MRSSCRVKGGLRWLALGAVCAAAATVKASWTNPGPTIAMAPPASSSQLSLYETLVGTSSSELTAKFRFSVTNPTLSDLSGYVEDGSTLTQYGNPFWGGTPWVFPVNHQWINVTNVDHTRRIFLLGASVPPAATTLSSLNPKPSWFIQTSTWLSAALTSDALELTPDLDRIHTYVNNFNFGSSNAAYIDFTFVIAHRVTFDWTRYRALFTDSSHQDYFTPPSTLNAQFHLKSGQTMNGNSIDTITSEFCRLEQKVLRVYAHKNEISDAFSTDTRITFGQPDTTGSVPVPDPNEPSQHVDFSASTYEGGLFIGQATMAGPQPDRSGKSITQIVAPVESNGTMTTLARAVTLYNPQYATGFDYVTSGRDVHAVHPNTTNHTLSQILAMPKRWGTRWPVTLSDPNSQIPGDPAPFSTTQMAGKKALYTWLMSPTQGITGSSQLVALYSHQLGPNTADLTSYPWWRYFLGPKYFTSDGVPNGLKQTRLKPRAWTISYSPLSTTSPVLSQYYQWP